MYRAFFLCIVCVSATPSCFHTSQQTFPPLRLLLDRFNCSSIFTKQNKQFKQLYQNIWSTQPAASIPTKSVAMLTYTCTQRLWAYLKSDTGKQDLLNHYNPESTKATTVCLQWITIVSKCCCFCALSFLNGMWYEVAFLKCFLPLKSNLFTYSVSSLSPILFKRSESDFSYNAQQDSSR